MTSKLKKVFHVSNVNCYKQHKILVLNGWDFSKHTEAVNSYGIYTEVNLFTKKIKKLHDHLPIPFKKIWYGEWKNEIKNYDVLIIFDGLRGGDIIKYIHKINPTARIIIYYVNKFKEKRNNPADFKKSPCELWSFDKNDCERIGMKFNHYFYNDDHYRKENIFCEKIYDALFIGADKGSRLKKLMELNCILEKYQYQTKNILVKAKNKSYKNLTDKEIAILTDKTIEYEDILKFVHQSKCIIEIQDTGQNGITLRAMEAMFFKKKLITDNLDVLNLDFYKRDNIFVLGYDKEERLETFLSTLYKPVNSDILKKYTWEAWLDRFFIDQ
jgi:hypothetical protein